MHALNKNTATADRQSKEGSKRDLALVGGKPNMPKRSKQNAIEQADSPQSFRALFNSHRVAIFDFLYLILGDEAVAQEKFKALYHKGASSYDRDNYSRFAKIWLFQLAQETLNAQFAEWRRNHVRRDSPMKFLPIDQRLILILRERCNFSKEEIARIMQISLGAVEKRLMAARERFARVHLGWATENPFSFGEEGKQDSLRRRILLQRALDNEAAEFERDCEEMKEYRMGMEQIRHHLRSMPTHTCPKVEEDWDAKPSSWRGSALLKPFTPIPWHAKLILESLAFCVVGALTVFFLPSLLAYYEGSEAKLVKAQAVLPIGKIVEERAPDLVERKLAAIDAEAILAKVEEADEFSDMEFPSGHHYRRGSAPLAPSRKKASIYRLIVQSESPSQIVPKIQSLLSKNEVKERDRSGAHMPGGVYFDGVTTEGNYVKLAEALRQLGPTRTYLNQRRKRKDWEAARVIIWVQQI